MPQKNSTGSHLLDLLGPLHENLEEKEVEQDTTSKDLETESDQVLSTEEFSLRNDDLLLPATETEEISPFISSRFATATMNPQDMLLNQNLIPPQYNWSLQLSIEKSNRQDARIIGLKKALKASEESAQEAEQRARSLEIEAKGGRMLKRKVSSLEKSNQDKDVLIERLEAALKKSKADEKKERTKRVEAEKKLKTVQTSNNNLDKEREKLINTNRVLTDQLNHVKAVNEALKRDVAQLKAKEVELQQIANSNPDLLALLNSLQVQLNNTIESQQQLEAQSYNLRLESEQLQARFDSEQKAHIETATMYLTLKQKYQTVLEDDVRNLAALHQSKINYGALNEAFEKLGKELTETIRTLHKTQSEKEALITWVQVEMLKSIMPPLSSLSSTSSTVNQSEAVSTFPRLLGVNPPAQPLMTPGHESLFNYLAPTTLPHNTPHALFPRVAPMEPGISPVLPNPNVNPRGEERAPTLNLFTGNITFRNG